MLAGSLLTFFAGLACECGRGRGRGERRLGTSRRATLPELTPDRLPNPLLIRGVLVGFTLGTIFSGGLIVQDKLAYSIRMRKAADAAVEEVLEENPLPSPPTGAELEERARQKEEHVALAGGAMADGSGLEDMGWIEWAMHKAGLGDKDGDKDEDKKG